jgi:hypothetical protein
MIYVHIHTHVDHILGPIFHRKLQCTFFVWKSNINGMLIRLVSYLMFSALFSSYSVIRKVNTTFGLFPFPFWIPSQS